MKLSFRSCLIIINQLPKQQKLKKVRKKERRIKNKRKQQQKSKLQFHFLYNLLSLLLKIINQKVR